MSVDSCSGINLRVGGSMTQQSQVHVGEPIRRRERLGRAFDVAAESSHRRGVRIDLNEPSSMQQEVYHPVPSEEHQLVPSHEMQDAATPSILRTFGPIFSVDQLLQDAEMMQYYHSFQELLQPNVEMMQYHQPQAQLQGYPQQQQQEGHHHGKAQLFQRVPQHHQGEDNEEEDYGDAQEEGGEDVEEEQDEDDDEGEGDDEGNNSEDEGDGKSGGGGGGGECGGGVGSEGKAQSSSRSSKDATYWLRSKLRNPSRYTPGWIWGKKKGRS